MKKLFVVFLTIVLLACFGFILVKRSRASVEYHYRYQILTQGTQYEANKDLEIKLYIKVEGEQVKQGTVTVNYDPNFLQFNGVKKWDIFEIETDTNTPGQIKIQASTPTEFSGEAPIAYLNFKTLQSIANITNSLTLDSQPIQAQPTSATTPTTSPQQTSTPASTNTPASTPTTSPQQTSTPASTNTPASTPTPDIPNCPKIHGDGPFTLVIIPDHYSDINEFKQDAQTAVDSMLNTNIPEESMEKLSFRYSSDLSKNYEVRVTQNDTYMNRLLATEVQQQCNSNAFLILSKKYPTISHSQGTGGFSTMGGKGAVVFTHSLFVVPHELSHALAGLFDEYSYHTTGQNNVPAQYYNCTGSNDNDCTEWKNAFPNNSISCSKTCGYTNWYRSSHCSPMNNITNPASCFKNFNPPSLKMWQDFFNTI